MTLRDNLKANGIEVGDSDKILIAPDFAFIKEGGKKNAKTKAATIIEKMIRGAEVDSQDIRDAKLILCEDLETAELEIKRVADIIHDGKHGVGVEYHRIAPNLIQCQLWKD
jgi:hypothetical protein